MKYYAIIVAGGSGSRMQSEIPKQFLLLSGRPVLMHTIEAFYRSDLNPHIILVLNKGYREYWNRLCADHRFNIPHKLVDGGEQRFHSVKNGLKEIPPGSIVAIHDAVRPMVSGKLITSCFEQAQEKGAVVCGVTSRDSVRLLIDNSSRCFNRESVYLIQTPQVFPYKMLAEAYEQPYLPEFTDDASVVEKAGHSIAIVEGESGNIKITFPEDIEIAEALLKKRIRKL